MYKIFETNLLTLFTMSMRNLARIFNKVFSIKIVTRQSITVRHVKITDPFL